MRRVSLLVYIDSQIYKLTIRMHFDQFNAVKEKKMFFFTTHPFSGLSHHAHFQTKTIDKSIAFFSNILAYDCRPNTHLPTSINEFSVTAHAQLIFEKLLASCIRWLI